MGKRLSKWIALFTVAALLFTVWTPAGSPIAKAEDVTVLSEDFQNVAVGGVPAGWTATTGANLVGVVQDGQGNRYLATTENANSVANTASFDFASPITTSFSVDMRVLARQINASSEGYFLTLRDGVGDKVIELLFSGSTISRRHGNNLKATVKSGITLDTWYAVHVEADMETKLYSVSIDGTPVPSATNIPFYKQASGEVAQFNFASYRLQAGTYYMDDIAVVQTLDGPVEPVNQAPEAVSVSVYGTAQAGQLLTGDYVYQDAEGDGEGASVYQWYRSAQESGAGRLPIAGATSRTYPVVQQDENHYLQFEVTPVALTGALTGTAAISAPLYIAPSPVAPAGTVTGSTVAFDGNGSFTDELDNLSRVFSYANGASISGGGAVGKGAHFSYYSPAVDLKSISLDVTYNKWTLTFSLPHELAAYEAVYDSSTGTFTNGSKVTLVRKLRPDLMSGVQYVKASYEAAAPLTPGTRYIRVLLPQAGYYGDTAAAADFRIDRVTLESASAPQSGIDGHLVDPAADFSLYVPGGDTSNLQAVHLTSLTDIRTFGTSTYVKRRDTGIATTAMTYEAPSGKDFKSAYVEGYYFANLPGTPAIELWISADGTTFTQYNIAGIFKHPAFGSSANNSIPDVLQANFLPEGIKVVRVRLAGNVGSGFPFITKAAFGYGPEVLVQPVDTDIVIKRATGAITLDGVVETDGNGAPAGEWAGSEVLRIMGVTDNNGDKHGAHIFLKYDDKKLYIGAKIKDPTPMVNTRTGTGIWNGDVLELFMGDEDMDFTQYPGQTGTLLPSDRQLVLGGGKELGYQSYMNSYGVNTFPAIFMELVKDADGKGYTMEAAVPLHSLRISQPWQGGSMLLNAVLSNSSYASRGQWGWTTTGEIAKKARGQFGMVTFEQASPPAAELTLSAQVNLAEHEAVITGQTLHVAGKRVTVTVTDPSGRVDDVDQTVSDQAGSFTFLYNLREPAPMAGVYTVRVGGEGIGVARTTAFVIGE
ncbi:MAG: S-layer protein [Paenibacillaceae bacterium]|jgi:hypothetical protein|nr:S-layer protein [Paenibacillaceae bacterium]